MSRDYWMMRKVMSIVDENDGRKLHFVDFRRTFDQEALVKELKRLKYDGIIESSMVFGDDWVVLDGHVSGLTDEGKDFWRLVENDGVWDLILKTLDKANVDLSQPMLKDVCEEVVRRYVAQFIPKI